MSVRLVAWRRALTAAGQSWLNLIWMTAMADMADGWRWYWHFWTRCTDRDVCIYLSGYNMYLLDLDLVNWMSILYLVSLNSLYDWIDISLSVQYAGCDWLMYIWYISSVVQVMFYLYASWRDVVDEMSGRWAGMFWFVLRHSYIWWWYTIAPLLSLSI